MLIYSQFCKALSRFRREIAQRQKTYFSNEAQSFQPDLGLPTAAFLIYLTYMN